MPWLEIQTLLQRLVQILSELCSQHLIWHFFLHTLKQIIGLQKVHAKSVSWKKQQCFHYFLFPGNFVLSSIFPSTPVSTQRCPCMAAQRHMYTHRAPAAMPYHWHDFHFNALHNNIKKKIYGEQHKKHLWWQKKFPQRVLELFVYH